jgi:uncharacterized membrane protein
MNLEKDLDTRRIQSLTDATFGVAMTILVLEVKIPSGLSGPELRKYFFEHGLKELFIYFIGFVTLGIFWIGSHFHHHHTSRTDRISSWLNILFLMLICIIPFSLGFLRNYRHEKLSIIFYSINLILASAANYLMLWYAWSRKYMKEHYSEKHYKNAIQRIFIPICCYLLVIIVSLFSTQVAIFLFLLPILLHLIPEKANEEL